MAGYALAAAIMIGGAARAPAQGVCATAGGVNCNLIASELSISDDTADLSFVDTDATQSSWGITINSGAPAGPNFFEVGEIGASTKFRIDGGAPSNSLRIASDGRVGLGTAAPAKPLHIVSNSPGIRFDDIDAPVQMWDLFGNGQEFGVFDATSGRTPFRMQNGAPENSLRVASNGNVGLGTLNPARPLHIASGSPGIRFEDTDDPTQSWNLFGNNLDFGVFNVTKATTPFSIHKDAPDNSLRIAANGYIGLDTNVPVRPLHIRNEPVIRLEYFGQNWDIFGTGNFGVYDAVRDSVPFRIEAGAPSDSIRIAASGNVGIGTFTPDASLDIEELSGNASINMTASTSWQIRSNGANDQLNFVNNTDSKTPFRTARAANHNLFQVGVKAANRIDVTGVLFINNVGPVNSPDYVFQPGYEIEGIEEHAAYMWENSHLPAVGAGNAEVDVMQATWAILEELEKAHIYIERLHEQAKQREAAFKDALAQNGLTLSEMERKLAEVEALLKTRTGRGD